MSRLAGRGNRYKSTIDSILTTAHPLLLYETDRGYLPGLYAQLGYRVGAEIGVGSGVFSEQICKANPGVHLYAIDAWKIYNGYIDFTDQEYLDKDYERAVERLTPYNVAIVREYSTDAAKMFSAGSLDFVYIDANHDAPFIGKDIAAWAPKVRSGGLVSGHDYCIIHMPVMGAVNAYVQAHDCGPLFVIGDPRERGDNERLIPSWFWVQK